MTLTQCIFGDKLRWIYLKSANVRVRTWFNPLEKTVKLSALFGLPGVDGNVNIGVMVLTTPCCIIHKSMWSKVYANFAHVKFFQVMVSKWCSGIVKYVKVHTIGQMFLLLKDSVHVRVEVPLHFNR
jgi:hypothetical protein